MVVGEPLQAPLGQVNPVEVRDSVLPQAAQDDRPVRRPGGRANAREFGEAVAPDDPAAGDVQDHDGVPVLALGREEQESLPARVEPRLEGVQRLELRRPAGDDQLLGPAIEAATIDGDVPPRLGDVIERAPVVRIRDEHRLDRAAGHAAAQERQRLPCHRHGEVLPLDGESELPVELLE